MGPIILCVLFLILSYQIPGARAVTPVFVQKGKDVCLDVMKAGVTEEFLLFLWKFKESVLVAVSPDNKITVPNVYAGRVEFSVKNYSVKLKNLQETDSGVYTAQVTASKEEQIAKYNVIVQDPVSPVELIVDSVSSSSDSCNLTVTCGTLDSHISSTVRCVNQTCSQEGSQIKSNVTTSGASLQVYLANDSIICNHSNQVSWTNNKEQRKIQHLCSQYADLKTQQNHYIVVILVVFIILVIASVAVLFHLKTTRKRKSMDINNTVYAVPQVDATDQTLDQCSVNDGSSHSPTSTYCLVGSHTGPMGSTDTRGRTLPESLYAQVERNARS